MTVSCGEGILPQLGQQCGGKTLTLTKRIHSNAFQEIPHPGTGGDQLTFIPKKDGGFHLLVCLQTGTVQKGLPSGFPAAVKALVKFNIQLEDALGMMSSSLKAGFSINQALEKVSEQEMHPIALEFRLLMQELQLGVPIDQALDNMARRIGSEDFELVATAIITARQTGGELTETLERVAALIRERGRINAKVRALTAMGRLQAIMIGAMPFLLLFGMYHISPVMMDSFVGSLAGVVSICVVVLLVICGFLTIRKITNVEV